VLHRLVRPQIATADAGACDLHESVSRFDDTSVGNALDPNVAGSKLDCARIDDLPPLIPRSGKSILVGTTSVVACNLARPVAILLETVFMDRSRIVPNPLKSVRIRADCLDSEDWSGLN
jgi:hypothetical protein